MVEAEGRTKRNLGKINIIQKGKMKIILTIACAFLAASAISVLAQCAGSDGSQNNPYVCVLSCGDTVQGCCTGTCSCDGNSIKCS